MFTKTVKNVIFASFLFLHAVRGKWLELSTPNLVPVYSIAVARHARRQRSKGQRSCGYENRYGCTVASECRYSIHLYAGVGLHVDTTAYVF